MTEKKDARVLRTHAKLLTTFSELLSEKSFEKISVQEICETAGVKRATFYKHFEDKYAFLKFFVGSLRDRFEAKLPKNVKPDATMEYYVAYIHSILNFLTENSDIVKNMLESDVFLSLLEVIKEKNYEDTAECLRKSVRDGMKLPASVEVTASMMTGAVASAIVRWIRDERRIPADTLVSEISSVIVSILG